MSFEIMAQINKTYGDVFTGRNELELGIALSTFLNENDFRRLLNSKNDVYFGITTDMQGNALSVHVQNISNKSHPYFLSQDPAAIDFSIPQLDTLTFVKHLNKYGFTFTQHLQRETFDWEIRETAFSLMRKISYIGKVPIQFPGYLRFMCNRKNMKGGAFSCSQVPLNIETVKDIIDLRNPFAVFAINQGRNTYSKDKNDEYINSDEFYNTMLIYCALVHFCGGFTLECWAYNNDDLDLLDMEIEIDVSGRPISIKNIRSKYGHISSEYFRCKLMDFFKIYNVNFKADNKTSESIIKISYPGKIQELYNQEKNYNYNDFCTGKCAYLYYKHYDLLSSE